MIDAATVDRFQRDGAACIRRLFRPEEMAVLRAGIDENLAHLSPRAKVASGADDAEHHCPALPRSYADEGARHPAADALAPGSAVLQCRRAPEHQLLDSG